MPPGNDFTDSKYDQYMPLGFQKVENFIWAPIITFSHVYESVWGVSVNGRCSYNSVKYEQWMLSPSERLCVIDCKLSQQVWTMDANYEWENDSDQFII